MISTCPVICVIPDMLSEQCAEQKLAVPPRYIVRVKMENESGIEFAAFTNHL